MYRWGLGRVQRKMCCLGMVWVGVEPIYFVAIFTTIVACVTAGIMRNYQDLIRIHFGSLLLIRTKFDDELQERRYSSVKTENLGTKVSQIGFFFVFYSVFKTKKTDHCMNASSDSMNGCC